MRKTFQAAQTTHEIFLTLVHSCEMFFDICPTEISQNGKEEQKWTFKVNFLCQKTSEKCVSFAA